MQIGTQKGGTTALNKLLSFHPNVLGAAKKEPHFFDFRGYVPAASNITDELMCRKRYQYVIENYHVDAFVQAAANQHVITFEKTPSYLRTPGVAAKVHRFYPNLKVIVVLRNPVERAYSFFVMQHERGSKLHTSLDALLDLEVRALRNQSLTHAPPLFEYREKQFVPDSAFAVPNMTFAQRMTKVKGSFTRQGYHKKKPRRGLKLKRMAWNTLYMGMYAQQIAEWMDYFPLNTSMKVIRFEHMVENNVAVFQEILEFLELPPIELDPGLFAKDYSPYKARNMHGPPDKLSPQTREYLRRFFKPYNDELADLLGEEWRDVWS
jgi:hypothetical protein